MTVIEPISIGAAFLAGLMGSGHCLGMCAPIAALSGVNAGHRNFTKTLIFNSGRLISYIFFGTLVGALGYTVGSKVQIVNWGLALRGGAGIVLALIGLQMLKSGFRLSILDALGSAFWKKLTPLAMRLQSGKGLHQLFGLGLLWGWLPCGLVYSMLAFATLSGGPMSGATIMMFFGLGTLPSMLGVTFAAGKVSFLRHPQLKQAMGFLMIIAGLWMATMPLMHYISMSQMDMH